MLQLRFATQPGRRKCWLVAGLLLGSLGLTRGQTAPPITVSVTPAAANICAGTPQTLTAQALYPPFAVTSGFDQKVRTLVVQPDGKILAGGDFTTYNGATRHKVARLNADGSLDTSFTLSGSGFDANVVGLAVQPNGKILVGGDFTTYNGIPRYHVARLEPNGSLDVSFVPDPAGGAGFYSAVNAFAIQPNDGKIVLAGAFGAYNSTNTRSLRFIARLDSSTAALDPSFVSTTGSGFDNAVNSLALQPDNSQSTGYKLLVGGDFTNYYNATTALNTPRSYVARLNADGTLDASFKPTSGTGLDGLVWALARQSTGEVLVGGNFTHYNDNGTSQSRSYVARLNADGTLDASFKPSSGTGLDGIVRALALQANGQVLVGGDFTHYNDNGTSQSRNYLARLNPDGTLDPTFNAVGGSGLNNKVFAVALQLDNKVLAGGDFTSYSDGSSPPPSRSYVARLNTDGSLNTSATSVAGASYSWASTAGGTFPALPTISVSAAGTYTATAVLNGAMATASAVVTVTPKPPTPSSSMLSGTVGDVVTITGTGLPGATVRFNGISAPVLSSSATTLLVAVPYGATTGPLTVTTSPCVATIGTFKISLLVNTPTITTTIGPGTYGSIVVLGVGALGGDVTATDSVVVLDGGVLDLGPYRLLGAGGFRLARGGTLSLGNPAGLTTATSANSANGAVVMTSRRYSDDANYIYTGTTNQVTGDGLPGRVRNLTDYTQNGGQLKLSAPTSVAQVLTMASATDFDLNGQSLKLLSDKYGTALVVNGPAGGKVVGQATMQRATTLSAAHNMGTGYRYYSPPVAGATVGSLAISGGFQPVVNPAYNTSNNPSSVLPAPTVFGYDETRLNTPRLNIPAFDYGLFSPNALSDALAVGAGYALTIPATETVSFTGTLTTGSLGAALTRNAGALAPNAGWNLVGNPYPAPLNWDSVRVADRPNLDAALYTYESTGPNTGVYFSYVNGVGDTPIIPAGRPFFVRVSKTSPAGTLLFNNRQRVIRYVADTVVVPSHKIVPRLVELRLAQDNVIYKDGGKRDVRPLVDVYEDAAALRTSQTIASVFDTRLDAYRIPPTTGLDLTMNINALVRADELAIKALPPFTTGQAVPLTVRVPQADGYTLRASKLQRLPSNLTAFLDDSVLHVYTNLSQQPVYHFTVSAAQLALTGGTIAKRFYLRFGSAALATRTWAAASDISPYPNPAHDQVTVEVPGLAGATEVQVTLLNALGQVVRQQTSALPPTGTLVRLALRNLATGVYALRLQANGATVVRRLVVD